MQTTFIHRTRSQGTNRVRWLPVLTLGAGLIACASAPDDPYRSEDGWRITRVEAVGAAAEIKRSALSDCRKTATAEQLARRQFAAVSYWSLRQRWTRIVLLSEGAAIQLHDQLHINVLSCSTPAVKTVH